MNADIVGFKEIFERPALYNVVKEANKRGAASNADVIPSKNKRYHRKAIFKKLAYEKYGNDTLFFAPNIFDGIPGNRRPGLAMLSRFGFDDTAEVIQDLPEPLTIKFPELGGGEAGTYTLTKLSHPIIKARNLRPRQTLLNTIPWAAPLARCILCCAALPRLLFCAN